MVIDHPQASIVSLYQEEYDSMIVDLPIYEAMDSNGKMIFNWVKDYIEYDRDNKILGLKTYPGSGKTFVLAHITTMLKPHVPYIYFTKTHDIIEAFNNYQGSKEKEYIKAKRCIHLKGKLSECQNGKGKSILTKYGSNNWYCEHQCPSRDECSYKETMRKILMDDPACSWAGHFMEYFVFYEKILKKKRVHDKYLLIFDEDFLDALFCHENYILPQLGEILKTKPKLTKTLQLWKNIMEICLKRAATNKPDEIVKLESEMEDVFIQFHKLFTLKELEKEEKHYDSMIEKYYDTEDELEYKNPYTPLIEIHKFFTRYQGTPKGFITLSHGGVLKVEYFRYLDIYDNCIILNATFESEIFYNFFPQGVKDRNLFELKVLDGTFKRNQHVFQIEGKKDKKNYRRFTRETLLEKDGSLSEIGLRNLRWTLYFAEKHKQTLVGCKDEVIKAISMEPEVQRLVLDKKAILCDAKTRKEFMKTHEGEDFIEYCSTFPIVFMNFSRGSGVDAYGDFDGCIVFQEFIQDERVRKKRESLLYQIDPEILNRNAVENVMYQFINRCRPLKFIQKNGKTVKDQWGDDAQHDFDLLIIPSTPLDLKFCDGHEGIQYFKPTTFYQTIDKNFISSNGKRILELFKDHVPRSVTRIRDELNINYNTLVKELKILASTNKIYGYYNQKKLEQGILDFKYNLQK